MNNQIRYIIKRVYLSYYGFRYSPTYPIVTPLAILGVSFLVFCFFILPQLESWFSINNEVKATQQKITIMRENSIILQNMNSFNVQGDFSVATKALPNDKDFAGILDAIEQSASVSNVLLNDYEFYIGAVSGRSSAPISVDLTLQGNVDGMTTFLYQIERKLPLVQVRNINISDNKGQIELEFYTKPFTPLQVSYSDQFSGISQEQRNVLDTLRGWSGQ